MPVRRSHVVEEAVAGVVVVVAVAAEAELVEQVVVDGLKGGVGIARWSETAADGGTHLLKLGKVRPGVEVRVLAAGDEKRRLGQWQALVGLLQQLGELFEWWLVWLHNNTDSIACA